VDVDAGSGLSNATIQQYVVTVRSFHDGPFADHLRAETTKSKRVRE
jgi:hypothetical protein